MYSAPCYLREIVTSRKERYIYNMQTGKRLTMILTDAMCGPHSDQNMFSYFAVNFIVTFQTSTPLPLLLSSAKENFLDRLSIGVEDRSCFSISLSDSQVLLNLANERAKKYCVFVSARSDRMIKYLKMIKCCDNFCYKSVKFCFEIYDRGN